jgi:methylmalonyl-CoA/ethylmalonyl-CoA epimerase
MLSPPENGAKVEPGQGAIYFRVADLALAVQGLKAKGADVFSAPHLLAPMPDHDLWMAFLRDPDGHLIGLMMEAPKGYALTK